MTEADTRVETISGYQWEEGRRRGKLGARQKLLRIK